MGQRKKPRILIGIVKDMTSIIKATISPKRNTKIHVAVIRATAHNVSSAPSDKRINAVLSLGHESRRTASTCIIALMDRLHGTKNASVALKCLFTIHTIITKDSFILKDQLSVYPSFGGRNFLNLSKFRDHSDPETWELSAWIRWYAAIVEKNLMVSRFLGHYLCCPSSTPKNNNSEDKEEKILALLSRDLLEEIDVLVDFVKVICEVPDSLHLQRNNLVYEIVRLVGGDYRLVQREISLRVVELGHRLPSLSFNELAQLLSCLKKFKDCKQRLRLLFVNRQRNDTLWELLSETKMKIVELMKEKGEIKRLTMGITHDSSELTGFTERFSELGPLVRFNSKGGWLGRDQVPLTVSTII